MPNDRRGERQRDNKTEPNLVLTRFVWRLENYCPTKNGKWERILCKLAEKGCDLAAVTRALVPTENDDDEQGSGNRGQGATDAWSAAHAQRVIRGLSSEGVPAAAECDRRIVRLDQAARALLGFALSPKGERNLSRPSEIVKKLRELLSTLREQARSKVDLTRLPRGRPQGWQRNCDNTLRSLGVPRSDRRTIMTLVNRCVDVAGPPFEE